MAEKTPGLFLEILCKDDVIADQGFPCPQETG